MKNSRKGFTITELVIVIAVIAILAAVLIPTFSSIIKKANDSSDLQTARNIMVEYIAQVDAATEEDYFIKVNDDTYFEVVDRKLQKDPVDADDLPDDAKYIYRSGTGDAAKIEIYPAE